MTSRQGGPEDVRRSTGEVLGLGFLGVRVGDRAAFRSTVALYRDVLGLQPVRLEPDRLAWFRLADGTALHVYGPEDTDHLAFGERPCVGLRVDDVEGTRRRMEAEGVRFLWDTQRDEQHAWAHYRGPDGTVYELIGPLGP
ncbi:VOC family protein [Ornithinimicrobium pekingense]|uniref:VOC domain-containing protein n=1 Tax=Ornithinimicrobium pekingense TaxID=384677 RepID=A0ABQ2FDW3_9MICO|nr:VOC family protein [Ornithinimicrobium pekingense]GGK79493.1 hypothetical protein GCM10011509_29990 [Ornithinimicrobium pekingense]